jgi:transposase-like protein
MPDQNGIVETGIKKRAVRGKWSAQQRREIVDASLVAGASINEVAERYGIRANLLTAWRRRHVVLAATAKPKKIPARFAAVCVNVAPVDGTIEIDLSNRLIRVRGIVDAGMLREVLAATR